MTQPTLEDFSELDNTGYATKAQTNPKDEFFHSIYISGKDRQNETGVVEKAGHLHIRGVSYNMNEVYMIITNIKNVLVKIESINGRESVKCFSYQLGAPPWKGTSGNPCGKNSAERAAVAYCNSCRSHLIVAGILTDNQGRMILNEEKKPNFVFLRAKATKYTKVANYLSDMSKMELSPIFIPATDESKEFEKKNVNHKRFVTSITIGKVDTSYGKQSAFELTKGAELPAGSVMEILKVAKKLVPKFEEKFDWSRNKNKPAASGYGEDGLQAFEPASGQQSKPEPLKEEASAPDQSFSFKDVKF